MTQKIENPKAGEKVLAAMRKTLGFSIPATMVLSGTLAVAFAIALDGCSNHDKNTNVSANNPSLSNPAPAVVPAAPAATPSPEPVAVKKPAIKKAPTLKYADKVSGVSFKYPGYFVQMPAEKDGSTASDGVAMNFSQPGGETVTAVKLPNTFATSIFKVSMKKDVSADECGQFAVPDASDVKNNAPADPSDGSLPSKTSIRGVEFSTVENATEQSDIKYYHRFVSAPGATSGSCYEFALGVSAVPDSKQDVDYTGLLDRLERILLTVKINPETSPAVTASVPAAPVTGTNPQ